MFLCSKYHPKFYRFISKNTTQKESEKIQAVDADQLSLPEDTDNQEITNDLTKDKSPTPTSILSEDEEGANLLELPSSEIEGIEVNFELIIKAAELIQEQFIRSDSISLEKNIYNIVYKQEKVVGPGTQLTNKKDWEIFLKEYERIIPNKRILLILVKMKRNPKKLDQGK